MMQLGFAGRVASVTGGGGGIGSAVAARLSSEGAKVVVVDLDGDAAAWTAEALGADALAVQADVSDVAEVGEAIRFAGPAGIVYEVYDGMERESLSTQTYLRPGIRKLGHLSFACERPEEVAAFWRDGLGFRVSDQAGPMTWMRCDTD